MSKIGQFKGWDAATSSSDEQAAELIKSAAVQLIQAAQLNPALESAVKQALMTIRDAVAGLAEIAKKTKGQ